MAWLAIQRVTTVVVAIMTLNLTLDAAYLFHTFTFTLIALGGSGIGVIIQFTVHRLSLRGNNDLSLSADSNYNNRIPSFNC